MMRTVQPIRAAQSHAQKSPPRIASLLPAFTDIVSELGQSSSLVAVSHECTTPGLLPSVTNQKISVQGLESSHISAGWNAASSLQHSEEELLTTHACSFYRINIPYLVQTQPTLLLTHLKPPKSDLDPDGRELKNALQRIIPGVTVLSANPTCLSDINSLYFQLGHFLNCHSKAASCVRAAKAALETIRATVSSKFPSAKHNVRVAVVQWIDPLYLAGDWVPSAVQISARLDDHVRPGSPSITSTPALLNKADIIIFALCALPMDSSERCLKRFYDTNSELPDPSKVRYIISDAISLFSRPTLSCVVNTAKAVAEIVMDNSEYGMKDKMWREWRPTSF